jgi:starch synthase
MNILFVGSECVPFAKTGGLADVLGALPKSLQKMGADVRVILPKFEIIPESYKSKMKPVASFDVQLGWRSQYCGLQELEHEGIHYYFIDNEYFFRRQGLYGYGDEAERFSYFSKAVLDAIPHMNFTPDVIHCHDWQAALIPVLLKAHYRHLDQYASIKTMLTIHNLKYQGWFNRSLLQDLLSLGNEYFYWDALGMYDGGSCLKGGLAFADILTTVSKTYAEEIQTPFFGENLDSVLRYRKDDLYGIVNGIDNDLYNPSTDANIAYPYTNDWSTKLKNKAALQEECGLPVDEKKVVIGIVSRLVEQKGLDLIDRILHEILELPVQVVVLGTGEYRYEQMFRHYNGYRSKQVSAHITFNESFAHRIYAGADLFLMPSLFEPCGIGQLLALRYLTVPIVRETGGLKDTVQAFNPATGEGTGFTFHDYNAHEMLFAISRAVELYADKQTWGQLIQNIASLDYGWDASAKEYFALYTKMVPKPKAKKKKAE